MKRKLLSLAAGLVLATTTLISSAAEQPIVMAGSSTIMPIMESLEPVFKKNGIELIIQGGGSSAGIKAVRDGMADIGMVSRSLTQSEQKKYGSFAFAGDLIVIIAHQSNQLSDIDNKTVKNVYSGKQTTWGNGKNITLISKENGRATQRVFEQHFSLFGQVSRKAVIIGANGQAIASVENDPNAIAYVSFNSAVAAKEKGAKIKILSLNGVKPSIKAAKSGKYELSRDLNLVYMPNDSKNIERIKKILKLADADAVLSHHRVINLGSL